jgi:hypothetical protein
LFIFCYALLFPTFGGAQNSQNQSKQFQSKQFLSKQFQTKQFQTKQFQTKQLITFFSSLFIEKKAIAYLGIA